MTLLWGLHPGRGQTALTDLYMFTMCTGWVSQRHFSNSYHFMNRLYENFINWLLAEFWETQIYTNKLNNTKWETKTVQTDTCHWTQHMIKVQMIFWALQSLNKTKKNINQKSNAKPSHSQSLALEKRNQPILRYIQIKVRDRFHGRYLFMLRKMHQRELMVVIRLVWFLNRPKVFSKHLKYNMCWISHNETFSRPY